MTIETACYCIKTYTVQLHRQNVHLTEKTKSSWIHKKKVKNISVKLHAFPKGKRSVPKVKQNYLHLLNLTPGPQSQCDPEDIF